jgi:tetratricopeptide (TPR) repeat protein
LRINRRKKGEQSQGVAIAYNNIGNIFKRKGRYEKALEYFNKSLKIKIKLGG